MMVELPEEKRKALLQQIDIFQRKKAVKIRDFAKLLGSLVACRPAVEYSLLHCLLFERAEIKALNYTGSAYDAVKK